MRAPVLVLALLAPLLMPTVLADERLPDLVGYVTPADIEPGVPVVVYYEVANMGVYDGESGSFLVEVYADDVLLETVRVSGLSSGEFAWLETSTAFTWDEGPHAFTVRVDTLDEVAETNEANNDHTNVVQFTSERPDLAIEVLSASAAGVTARRAVVAYRVCNVGSLATSGNGFVWLRLRHDSLPLAPQGFDDAMLPPPLAAGACVEGVLETNGHVRLGVWQFEAGVYAGSEPVWERYGPNNRAAGTVDFGPVAGL